MKEDIPLLDLKVFQKEIKFSMIFLQKNFEKPIDLKLKGVSSDKSQISSVYYSTKPEASSPYSRTTNEEEDDTKSVCPSDSDFPPIDNPV